MYDRIEELTFYGRADGTSDIVEIDECIIGKKRKYNRGAPTKGKWVFGIIERGTRKTYFKPVTKRSKDVLLPIIKERIKVGATIFHDDWAVYRNLDQHGYDHDVVVHQREFVSETGACTNTVEGNSVNISILIALIIIIHISQ